MNRAARRGAKQPDQRRYGSRLVEVPRSEWPHVCSAFRGAERVFRSALYLVTVGRPVARHFDDGYTAEVTRCCTDGTPNACSKLYAAAARAAKALGYRRLITYTLKSEPGTSLKAAGWRVVWEVKGRTWSCKSRPRVDKAPTEDKLLWEAKS
jgi:hypothetical protein